MGLVPLKVVSNGKDITSVIRDFFVSLTINDEAGLESDNFQLVLADDGKVAFPRTEATMDIYTGQDFEHLVFRGSFTVNSVKLSNPDKTIVISGDAANLGGSFKTQRDQTWQNTDLKSMVETIAERNGFTPSVEEQYSEVAIPHFVQAGQSDADLVNELAKEHGATMKIASNKLIFFQKGNNQSVSGKALPPVPVQITDSTEAEIELKGTGNVAAVEAFWQSVEQGQKQVVRVGKDNGKVKKLSKVYPTKQAAQAAAEAVLYQEQRGDYVLTLDEFPFISGIRAERNIVVSGHTRREFNTEWMCSKVTEVLGADGHTLSGEFVIPKQKAGELPHLK